MSYPVNNGYTLQLPERPDSQKRIREKQHAAKLPNPPKLNVTSIIFAVMLLVLVTKGCEVVPVFRARSGLRMNELVVLELNRCLVTDA